jgi:chorismate synthase
MASNSLGVHFRISTFGESHGDLLGVLIDGCPAGLSVDINFIQRELDKRKPGTSELVSQRKEDDIVRIVSGVFEGKSTGAPICMLINNHDQKPKDYDEMRNVYRPSHADFTYQLKYGIRDHRGGGRSSARETLARVAAGALAKLLLKEYNIEILAYTGQVGNIVVDFPQELLSENLIYNSEVRCPDPVKDMEIQKLIRDLKEKGDSIGAVIHCVIRNLPPGLGQPLYDKLEADMAKAMLGINASRGFDIGMGFRSAEMKGSVFNDPFMRTKNGIQTAKNNNGGILGGISTGMDLYFRVAFKPLPSISIPQQTVDHQGNKVRIELKKERQDTCVVPRAVVVVEAMAALVIADHLFRKRMDKLKSD